MSLDAELDNNGLLVLFPPPLHGPFIKVGYNEGYSSPTVKEDIVD
jgi:hypothetical protein